MELKNKAHQLASKIGENFLLPLNLQYFAEGGEGQQGDGQQQSQSQNQHQQQSNHQNLDGQQSQHQQKSEGKTFTQEDVNGLVAKESKKAQEKLLKQLGIEDFKTAKDGLEKFREWQESQKTEAEKQQERLQKLEQDHSSTLSENESLKAQLSALKVGVKAESVEDVVVLAKNLVSDDVDMDEAINQVVEKYPHFKVEQQRKEGEGDQKPSFSTGQHSKQQESELDKWVNAFKIN